MLAARKKEPPPKGDGLARVLLFIFGGVLIAIAVIAWLAPDSTPTTGTVTEGSKVTVVAPPAVSSANPTPTGPQTTTTTTDKTTATITPPSTKRSDVLIGALLGVGAVFLLGGAFFYRVTGFTLPGGAGVSLGEVVATKLLAKAKPKTQAEKEKVERAYIRALAELPEGTSPGDDITIERVTDEAWRSV